MFNRIELTQYPTRKTKHKERIKSIIFYTVMLAVACYALWFFNGVMSHNGIGIVELVGVENDTK